jgi:hypothetical protein
MLWVVFIFCSPHGQRKLFGTVKWQGLAQTRAQKAGSRHWPRRLGIIGESRTENDTEYDFSAQIIVIQRTLPYPKKTNFR